MWGNPSRRDFLKGTAALVAALSLSSWFPLARGARGRSKLLTAGANSFDPLPSQLATGQPIADIAAGWDGTQWAVDTLGIPHLYDPLQQKWVPSGAGVDAATQIAGEFYLFRGAEVAVYNPTTQQVAVQPIAAQWPQLPASFTSDLEGAFANGTVLYLCRGGRYVFADLSASPVTFSQPAALNTWPGWPTADPWGQGVIAVAGTWVNSSLPAALIFPLQTPPAEYLEMFLLPGGSVNPTPIAEVGRDPLTTAPVIAILTSGDFDAYVTQTSGADYVASLNWVFQGPVVWTQFNSDQNQGPTTPVALASWVPAWLPTLRQAPRGRVGSLWSVTTGGAVVYHDGAAWNQAPALPGATVLSVDVGEDGVPFAVATANGAALYQLDTASMTWQQPISLGGITPKQVAVGDATRVYVLGTDGTVSKLVGGGFAQVPNLQAGIAHIAANHDGTLWHCDGQTTNAFRYISEQPYQAALPVPNVTSVQQVASTGYGNAFMLVQQAGAAQVYTYSSPAVFKTSPSFVPIVDGPVLQHSQIEAGGGRCFVNLGGGIAALDSHTGAQLWLAAAPAGGSFAAMTYDPLLHLLYATDNRVTLAALDAATGEQVWSFQVGSGPLSQPAVSGSGLCVVGDNVVYWLDTRASLARAQSNPALPVQPVWTTPLYTTDASLAVVLIEEAAVIVTLFFGSGSTTPFSWTLALQDGSVVSNVEPGVLLAAQVTPRAGRAPWNGNRESSLVWNAGFSVVAFPIPFTTTTYGQTPAPAGSGGLARGLALHDGVIYAGGKNGILYSLADAAGGAQFQPVTPASVTDGGFAAGPIAVPDGQGGALLVFSGQRNNTNAVWIYDLSSGDLAQVGTDQLLATQLTVDENGVLYAAGNPGTSFGQVYAIRIDDVLQQERSFIVDSELMQDFDEPAAGQLTATARYQTHVTIVDALKAPRAFQSVKVWADTATLTLVQIDGAPYFINSTIPAIVQTDATGTLAIVSDATDLSTTALKLWAGFMNPYERIVVYPDREFHTRLTTTHADASATNPDPTQINLATATTYDVANLTKPPTLFASSEQAQATTAAGAVQQLTAAVGYQKGVTPAAAHAGRAGAPSPNSYLAYSDLPGAAYGPVDTPANRLVTPLAMTGFSFDGATVTPLSVADAANAIDALAGQAPAEPGSVFSWLRKLWEKIKSGAAKVVQIVVSVGKEIYLGLKYVEASVTKVLRQALRDIEDVAIAIGSVFVQLGKDIVKVAEALSVIFHLGEVVATFNLLKGYFTTWTTTTLPNAIDGAKATIQNELADLETSIKTNLQALIAYFDGSQAAAGAPHATPPMQNLQGVGQSPHTAFTVTPKTGGKAQPVAVPALWGTHKLRNNLAQSSAPGSPGADAPDFVVEFIRSFAADPNLQQALANAKQQFDNSFHPTSAKAFFAGTIGDLLSLIEVIAVAAVDGIRAGVNVVLDNVDAVVSALSSWGNAEIPILSTLLGMLGLKDVTFLDIITFVAAIPVTLVYRVVYGVYPASGAEISGAAAADLAKVVGIMSGVLNIVNGIFAAIVDADATIGDTLSAAEKTVKLIVSVILALITAATYIAGDVATPSFGVIFASVVTLLQSLLGFWSPDAADAPSLEMVPSIFGALMATPLLLFAYVEQYEDNNDVLGLSSNVVSVLALFVNPLKFADEAAVIPLAVDIVAGVANGYLTLLDTLAGALPPPTALPVTNEPAQLGPHRLYMPAILQGR
jgi:outer membrane protein assembly factor BamB